MIWTTEQLRSHLQFAVDLEFWTIPFYLCAWQSLQDRDGEAGRLLRAVVVEEMFHLQLAANLCNAFGRVPKVALPHYAGTRIPHLDFGLDSAPPFDRFPGHRCELGPLDEARLATMCLIEFPEWGDRTPTDLRPEVAEYGSIGHFYEALRAGMKHHAGDLEPGVRQFDWFADHYPRIAARSVTDAGTAGIAQAEQMLAVIVAQGEGVSAAGEVPEAYRSVVGGGHPELDHFGKFERLRALAPDARACLEGRLDPPSGSAGARAQRAHREAMVALRDALNTMFATGEGATFGAAMDRAGQNMRACWDAGAVPSLESDAAIG